MKFYDKPIEITDLNKAASFCKLLGIKVRFKADEQWNWAAPMDSTIQVDPYEEYTPTAAIYRSKRDFWSSLLHEITHVLLYRRGKYIVYHSCRVRGERDLTVEEHDIIMRTGLKAERMADREAAKLMRILFPKIPYKGLYHQKTHVKNLRDFLKNWGKNSKEDIC